MLHKIRNANPLFFFHSSTNDKNTRNSGILNGILNGIFNAGADTLSRAIAHAMLAAETVGTARSYCDRYPSACADFPSAQAWRTQGTAVTMTPKLFKDATKRLEVASIPN